MEQTVEQKLASIQDDIRDKIQVYLQWCESPIERLVDRFQINIAIH